MAYVMAASWQQSENGGGISNNYGVTISERHQRNHHGEAEMAAMAAKIISMMKTMALAEIMAYISDKIMAACQRHRNGGEIAAWRRAKMAHQWQRKRNMKWLSAKWRCSKIEKRIIGISARGMASGSWQKRNGNGAQSVWQAYGGMAGERKRKQWRWRKRHQRISGENNRYVSNSKWRRRYGA
jgi:hypothetical protein